MFPSFKRKFFRRTSRGAGDSDDDDDEREYYDRLFQDFMMSRHARQSMFDRYRFDEDEVEEPSPIGEDGFKFQEVEPHLWKPPKIREPDPEPTTMEEAASSLTPMFTDQATTSKLRQPDPEPNTVEEAASSSTPMVTDQETTSTDVELYRLPEKVSDNSIVIHSVLRMPSSCTAVNKPLKNTLNIAMIDGSGSMSTHWGNVQQYWNDYVAPNLTGITRIFCFDTRVRFRRSGTKLERHDFKSGSTELTGALQAIVSQVYECSQKYVNVFIVTDGDHNGSNISPDSVINKMESPVNKVCNIYLLGIGENFPVQYSIDIRSRLHNGSSNLPALYWAKNSQDIREQMENIEDALTSSTSLSLKLNIFGSNLPGLQLKDTFYLKEFVYLSEPPETYKSIIMENNWSKTQFTLEPKDIDIDMFLNICRQWNSVLTQMKCKKLSIPEDIIPLMERIYQGTTTKGDTTGPKSLKERLAKKDKGHEMEFRQLINGIKTILTQEKFANELELAETILNTGVTKTKYQVKALQLKGHTDKEYSADCEAFMKVYAEHKEAIQKLKVEPHECCQATHQSTLFDLQDADFQLLMDKNKFEFLKEFTVSGIPVLAPTRDSVTLNPWSYRVKKILNAPYIIMSQVAMENMPQISHTQEDKEVQADNTGESTNFNAIVPVFSPHVAKTLQPIVRTRLYAMCATFAILKNPHMIDFNIHMAALGVTWVRCLYDHPDTPRPEHVRIQMESIEATAACYMDRPGFANYATLLKENTLEALMTESNTIVEGKTIKCETIIKPMFILNMIQHGNMNLEKPKVASIVQAILLEYIGRCLCHYRSHDNDEENTPFTDFFADSLSEQENKKQLVEEYVETSKAEMGQSNLSLLETFYTYDEVTKAAKKVSKAKVQEMEERIAAQIPTRVNIEKVKQLRNVSLAGDLSWDTLLTFAKHVGLGEDEIQEIFGHENIFVSTAHALKYRSSKERLSNPVEDYETCKKHITELVQKENLKSVNKQLYDLLLQAIQDEWLSEYQKIHTEVVEPMTRQQIIHRAQSLGIQVSEETFDEVYKRYRPNLGLLGNACQTKACPYYLQPNKKYNNHATVERLMGRTPFIHAMHQTAFQYCESELETLLSNLASGSGTKDKKPVPEEDVYNWRDDIKKLKNIYSEKEKVKKENI